MLIVDRVYDRDGRLIAVVFNLQDAGKLADGAYMFTPSDWGVQVGVLKRGRGYRVWPHIHVRARNGTVIGAEALVVLKGKIRVHLYDDDGHVRSLELGQGMGIVMACGHGVEFLEDSVVLEIKEGPYPGPEEDKVWIHI